MRGRMEENDDLYDKTEKNRRKKRIYTRKELGKYTCCIQRGGGENV